MVNYPEVFDECKGPYKHAWFDADSDWAAPFGGTPFTLRCERCGTERRDTFDIHGELMTRRYVYPEGYKHAAGMTMAEYRLLIAKRRGLKPSRKKSAPPALKPVSNTALKA